MKILIFIHSLSCGGAERVVASLSWYWAERGHTVTLVTLAGIEQDFYSLHPQVKRIALKLAGESGSLGAALGANLRRIWALHQVLKHELPDVVLSMMTTANVLAILAGTGLPCSVVVSERIHPPQFYLGRVWEWLRRWSYGLSDAVVALTRESADWLRQHTTARWIAIIPNPISWPLSCQPPVVEPQFLFPNNRKLILAVGRLASQKGFDLLLKAFARVASTRPDWDLVILGEGPERGSLEELAKSLGILNRVYLLGKVGNVGDWYARAQFYVMSSRFEGFPNTLVEALAYGCPAVSFDCDTGPRDIIRHEIDGLLVAPGDIEALASAMARLMDDEMLRSRLSAKAVEARERFSIERIGAMWDRLFEEVAHGRNRLYIRTDASFY